MGKCRLTNVKYVIDLEQQRKCPMDGTTMRSEILTSNKVLQLAQIFSQFRPCGHVEYYAFRAYRANTITYHHGVGKKLRLRDPILILFIHII